MFISVQCSAATPSSTDGAAARLSRTVRWRGCGVAVVRGQGPLRCLTSASAALVPIRPGDRRDWPETHGNHRPTGCGSDTRRGRRPRPLTDETTVLAARRSGRGDGAVPEDAGCPC